MKTTNTLKTAFGPLWKIYSDSDTHEIMIDAFDEVYYDYKREMRDAKVFKTAAELDKFVERLQKLGNSAGYFKLEDDTVVQMVLPPYVLKGPSIVISKLPKVILTLDDLIKFKALTQEGKVILEKILKEDKGFLVAGNMGSGKTTVMNILVDAKPAHWRLVTLERFPSLILQRQRVCRLVAPNQKASEMVELVDIAERMRADFVVLGDVMGPEVMPFIDLIRSYSTGAALIKGENVFDAIKILETKAVLSSDGLTLEDVRYAIAQSFKHIIFQQSKENGSRLLSTIAELSYDSGELKIKVIYKQV